jgi:hypothetical protein
MTFHSSSVAVGARKNCLDEPVFDGFTSIEFQSKADECIKGFSVRAALTMLTVTQAVKSATSELFVSMTLVVLSVVFLILTHVVTGPRKLRR